MHANLVSDDVDTRIAKLILRLASCLGSLKRRGLLAIDSHRLVVESEELLASLTS